MDAMKTILGRVSARKIGTEGPDAAQVARLMEAGGRAPDHGMLGPWRFITIEGAARGRLGDAMAAIRARAQPDAEPAALQVERDKAFRAPLVVAVACVAQPHPKVPHSDQLLACAAAAQNIVLAAEAMGFAANWKTGPAATDAGVKSLLGLPADAAIVALIYVGARTGQDSPRAALLDGRVSALAPPPA